MALFLTLVSSLMLAGCGGTDGAGARRESDVRAHLRRDLDVSSNDARCAKDGSRAWECVVTTDDGVKVEVRVTRANGETQYETVRGLLDGASVESRLREDYERRLGKSVAVSCDDVIEANDGDRVTCKLTPEGEATRRLVVRVVDDQTGDVAVVGVK